MNLKLGQIFWMRDLDECGNLGRSDFECKVVGIKVCEFLNTNNNFTDYLVERTRLNSYHESFKSKDSRTKEETFRYDPSTKELNHWYEVHWPMEGAEWQKVTDKICIKKPKNLRKGPNE